MTPEVTLLDMFESHTGRQVDKWRHYFDIYEKHFARFRHKPMRLLELGVDHGGSLQLWKRYFGPEAEIIGIDIDDCRMYAEERIGIWKYDQCNPAIAGFGPFDIVIDDGSHHPEHQVQSFANLWPKTTGVYLIEDCHRVYPSVNSEGGIKYTYPCVVVYERPVRMIRGEPSRELRPDEAEARKLYGP
jgi:hypothetical protein